MTPPTVTRDQILALRAEAVDAGDTGLTEACDLALLALQGSRAKSDWVARLIEWMPPEPGLRLADLDTVPPWWADHSNLAELHRYLTGSDCPEGDALDPSQVQYFLEKPWKWTAEWDRMRAKEKTS